MKPCPYRAVHEYDTDGLCKHCFAPAFKPSGSTALTTAPVEWWRGWTSVGLMVPAAGGWREVEVRTPVGGGTGYGRSLMGPGAWVPDGERVTNQLPIKFFAPRSNWGSVEAVGIHRADGGLATIIAIPPIVVGGGCLPPWIAANALTWVPA